jgi:hypothetical protein
MESDASSDMTPLLDAAISMHELFLTLTQAGFTEAQALYIVAQGIKPGLDNG